MSLQSTSPLQPTTTMMLCQNAHIAAHIYSRKKLAKQCGAAKRATAIVIQAVDVDTANRRIQKPLYWISTSQCIQQTRGSTSTRPNCRAVAIALKGDSGCTPILLQLELQIACTLTATPAAQGNSIENNGPADLGPGPKARHGIIQPPKLTRT